MAKEQKTELLGLLQSTENALKKAYGDTYKDVLKIAQVRQAIESGADFSWSGNTLAFKQLEEKLKILIQKAESITQNATNNGWNKGQDSVGKTLGAAVSKGESEDKMKEIVDNATKQMQKDGVTAHQFYNKPQGGLTISSRVWKNVQDSKKELEIIIQNAIIEGKTPDQATASLNEYLNYPNRLYHRVRDPETGELKLSKAAAAFHPGRGVYRSSYQNCMRLARTEVNMAYRKAELESYRKNPSVIGYRIVQSGNHTTKNNMGGYTKINDVCDQLAGDYPLTFTWTGWHPQCRCYIEPILIDEKEFEAKADAMAKGKLDEWKPANTITDVPDNFKQWVTDNSERIQAAKVKPFFIRDNYKDGDITKGLIDDITSLADQVKKQQKSEEQQWKELEQFLVDYEEYQSKNKHQSYKDLKKLVSKKQDLETAKELKQKFLKSKELWDNYYAEQDKKFKDLVEQLKSIEGESEKYKKFKEIADSNILSKEISAIPKIKKYIEKIQGSTTAQPEPSPEPKAEQPKKEQPKAEEPKQEVKEKKEENEPKKEQPAELPEYFNVLANPAEDIKKYGYEAVEKAAQAINATLQKWESMPLETQVKKLNFEIAWVENNKKYDTWKVSQDAYVKKLTALNIKIVKLDAQKTLHEIESYSTGKTYKELVKKANETLINGSMQEIADAIDKVQKEKDKLEAGRNKKNAKGITADFDSSCYTDGRKNNATWFKDIGQDEYLNDAQSVNERKKANAHYLHYIEETWKKLTHDEKNAIYGYTEGSSYINEPFYTTYCGSKHEIEESKKDINGLLSAMQKSKPFEEDLWVQSGQSSATFMGIFGVDIDKYQSNPKKLVGMTGRQSCFISTAVVKRHGFKNSYLIFNIYMPKGSRGLYVENISYYGGDLGPKWDGKQKASIIKKEMEIIIPTGCKFRITKAEYNKKEGRWYIDVDLLGYKPEPPHFN